MNMPINLDVHVCLCRLQYVPFTTLFKQKSAKHFTLLQQALAVCISRLLHVVCNTQNLLQGVWTGSSMEFIPGQGPFETSIPLL